MGFIDFFEQNAEALTFFATVGGGIFALYQWRLSVKNRQAEYVDNLLERLQTDDEIKKFIFINDYDEEWYNNEFHESDDRSTAIMTDRTLFFLDYLCHIRQEGLLHRKEFAVFEYYLFAVTQSMDTQSYLADVYQYSLVEERKFPFKHILDYGIKNKIIPPEIINDDYYKYIFMIESGMDNVPEKYYDIYSSLGRKRFIYTYSRCEFCTRFDSENHACNAECDCDSCYWGLSYNLCPKFCFDPARWEENKKKASYHEIKKKNNCIISL